MMFKKKLLASAIATAALTVGVVSTASAVTISNTDVGQVLMGEMYLARTPGESTQITVMNTDLTNAVKAKLVFRSKKHSDECMDMILYLTPGDVAYVTAYADANGVFRVKSDDDSIMSLRKTDGTIKFASQDGFAFDQPMKRLNPAYTGAQERATEPARDSCGVGHVEVVAAYAASGTVSVATGSPVVVRQGMSKFDLLRIFDTPKSVLNTLNPSLCRVTNDLAVACDGADYNRRVRLMGTSEIAFNNGSPRIMNNMVALNSGANPHTVGTTHAVTNETFDVRVDIGAETLIGLGMGEGESYLSEAGVALAGTNDKLWDVEGALKTTLMFGYYADKAGKSGRMFPAVQDNTSFQITFPTKYRHIPQVSRYNNSATEPTTYTPPFTNVGRVNYTNSLFDTQENSAPGMVGDVCFISPCPTVTETGNALVHEVNYEALAGTENWSPVKGWYRFTLVGTTGQDTAGSGQIWSSTAVPAIGFSHYYQTGMTNSVVSRLGR